MRLSSRATHLQPGSEWSKMRALCRSCLSSTSPSNPSLDAGGNPIVHERHRHRYEVNPAYVERLDKAGLRFVGKDETGERM